METSYNKPFLNIRVDKELLNTPFVLIPVSLDRRLIEGGQEQVQPFVGQPLNWDTSSNCLKNSVDFIFFFLNTTLNSTIQNNAH